MVLAAGHCNGGGHRTRPRHSGCRGAAMSDGAASGHPTDKRPDKTKLAFWKSFLRHFFEKDFNVGFLKLAPPSRSSETRTALAKCPSENWPSWSKKIAVIRALSLELSRMRPLTFGNVAQFAFP
jgi:hypothetical protein